MIKDVKPRDQLEAMLAAQMAVIHKLTMAAGQRLGDVNSMPPDSALNDVIKLARTFAIQLEALKRYRTGGEQKVTVQHVNVSEGGQAIVGNVTTRAAAAPQAAGRRAAGRRSSSAPPMPAFETRKAAPAKGRGRRKNGGQSSA